MQLSCWCISFLPISGVDGRSILSILRCPMRALRSSLCVFIIYGRLSFLLSKTDENLIRSLEHVDESRGQETSPGIKKGG